MSQALATIVIKLLGERGWTASRIMAHRFYLLILLAAVLAALGPGFALASSAQLSMVHTPYPALRDLRDPRGSSAG